MLLRACTAAAALLGAARGQAIPVKPGFTVPTLPTGTIMPGNCGQTENADCASGSGTAGAWSADPGPPTTPADEVPKTLEECVAKCVACPASKCTYVSFSAANQDCRCTPPHPGPSAPLAPTL